MRAARTRTSGLTDAQWVLACRHSSLLAAMSADDQKRLRGLARRFLLQCRIRGVQDFVPDDKLTALIAGEAVVLVAGLTEGVDAFQSVREVVVYPTGFVAQHEWTDEFGVVHQGQATLSGEVLDGGAMALAADDVLSPSTGFNVVLHEFAHVLDAGNGALNGFPNVRDVALRKRWPIVFKQAWQMLDTAVQRGEPTPVDAYALTDEAEFFAVCVESFFTDVATLEAHWPGVFELLLAYFGCDPRPWLDRVPRRRERCPRLARRRFPSVT